jgi:hypothetical protein
MAKGQPDFKALFYSSLGGDVAPIRYSLRSDSNFHHDVVFINSLIHDARVKNPGVMPVEGVLAIELNRDCWELGYTPRADGASELHVADARLELKGVRSVEWRLCGEEGRDPWIDGFEVRRRRRLDDRQGFSIRLSDSDWWFVASMPAEDWSVELVDLECPYLWSRRYGPNAGWTSTERIIE